MIFFPFFVFSSSGTTADLDPTTTTKPEAAAPAPIRDPVQRGSHIRTLGFALRCKYHELLETWLKIGQLLNKKTSIKICNPSLNDANLLFFHVLASTGARYQRLANGGALPVAVTSHRSTAAAAASHQERTKAPPTTSPAKSVSVYKRHDSLQHPRVLIAILMEVENKICSLLAPLFHQDNLLLTFKCWFGDSNICNV